MRMLLGLSIALFAAEMVVAQVTERRGTAAVTEGVEYVVAFPQVHASPTEKPLPRPMFIHIASRYNATVRVSNAATDSAINDLNTTFTIEPNTMKTVNVDVSYMNGYDANNQLETETIRGLGIRIQSTAPISVYTVQSWMGNGEMTRHLPVAAWGTSYLSMNMYQDRYGTPAAGLKHRPSQILIIAAHDSTDVTYVPTIATEGSSTHPSLRAGEARTVRLQAGQTFIIKDKIVSDSVRRTSTDLSGTSITATKPIAVISGTTKAAIARMPDVLPPTGMFSAEAHFVRNNVHDVMMPTTMAGTSFVTVPTMYTFTRRTGGALPEYGMDDDRGDVIRFVAVDSNTIISAMRADGKGMRTVATLQRGKTHLEMAVEQVTYWQSNKPVLVGQYGKSWARVLPPALLATKASSDHQQGHPTVESGMPMLQVVPSLDRTISSGAFYAPEGMDNFLTVVFKTGAESQIRLDDHSTLARFSPKTVAGTPFSYIRTAVTGGDHWLRSDHDSVRWHAWTYGSLDGLQQGRAYGTTLGYDISVACADSIAVHDTVTCDVRATVELVSSTALCSTFRVVTADTLVNATFTVGSASTTDANSLISYVVEFQDKRRSGRAVIRVQTSAGTWVQRVYTYDPKQSAPLVQADGITTTKPPVHTDSLACRTITVRNPTTVTALIHAMRVTTGDTRVTFNPSQLDIPPGGQGTVTICRPSNDVSGTLVDEVIASVGCAEQSFGVMRSFFARPTIICQDQDWVDVSPASFGSERPVGIQNASDVPLTIRAVTGDTLDLSVGHFGNTRGLDTLPIVVPAKSIYTWYVTYSPKGQVGATHLASVRFVSDAIGTDSISVLRGSSSLTSVTEDEAAGWSISPNPTTGLLHLDNVDGVTSMELISQHGAVSYLPVHTTIDLGHMPTGVYTLRMVGRKSTRMARVVLAR